MVQIERPIKRVTPLSGANLLAVYCATTGWISILIHALGEAEGFKVDVNSPFPLVNFYFDFHVSISENPFVLIIKIVALTLLSAIVGWLIGLVWAVAYNLTSKYLGLRLEGRLDLQEASQAPNQPRAA